MSKFLFVGDIHGDFRSYREILNNHSDYDATFQVGDFGHGFVHTPILDAKNRHIRGNHDKPADAFTHPNYIEDGSLIETPFGTMFCMGGGLSIDKYRRHEGIDWWEDEELSYAELHKMIDIYDEAKPSIVVTHDCPQSISIRLFGHRDKNIHGSRTQQALETMFYIHKPKFWFFGHYHEYKNEVHDGTRFVCLNRIDFAGNPDLGSGTFSLDPSKF